MPDLLERAAPVRAFRELRRDFPPVVLVLASGDLVASFGFSLVFPFLTIYLTQQLGATAAQAGLVLAGYSVCSIVSGAAGGWLADRIGRRRVMIPSVATTALIVIIMGQARNLLEIGLLTVALGLIDPAFIPAARAAIADVVPEARRPRAYGLLAVAAAVGWIAGPAIGAGLATLGYPLLFTIAGLIISSYAVIGVVWLPETLPRPNERGSAGHPEFVGMLPPEPSHQGLEDLVRADYDRATARPDAPGWAAPRPTPDPASRVDPGRRQPAADGPPAPAPTGAVDPRLVFAAFLPMTMVVHAATFQWVTTLPIFAARSLGVPTTVWGILFSINGILIVLFQLRVSTLVERFSKPRVMAVAMLLYAVGSLVTAVATAPGLVVAGLAATIILVTFGEILLFPMEPAFVSDLSPAHQRGRYQGLALAAAGVGSALGPPLGGLCLDVAPGPLLWIVNASALGVVAAALWLLGAWSRRAGAVARLGRAGTLAS